MTVSPVRGKWLQRSWLVGTLVVGLLAAPFAASASPAEGQSAPAAEVPSQVPPDPTAAMAGYFIENAGQATDGVRFYTTGNPSLAFLDDGVMFVLSEKPRSGLGLEDIPAPQSPGLGPTADISRSPTSHAYLIRFEGANRIVPAGNDELTFHSNFFRGADSGLWRKGVRNYGEVVYSGLYDGVTLAYHVTPQGTKYEFLVEGGGDPSRIVMTYSGVDSIGLDRGDLVVVTPLGEVRDSAPVSFQGRDPVSCTFVLRAPRSVGFACATRDPSRLLVIDPLIYSTFLGGPGYGGCISIDVGPQGNAYVTGWRDAPGFPVTPGAFNRTYHGGEEAFIAELDATGGSLVYATYIGGSGDDRGYAIVLDPGGFAVVTGRTNSPDFPVTAGAFSTSYDGGGVFGDAFITKLSPDGSALAYSSYLGGSSDDTGSGITLDTVGDVYITGETYSDDFPVTPGAFQGTMKATSAAFVAKLDPTGSVRAYSTFLAGSGLSHGADVKVDLAGNAYVSGVAWWRDFPVTPGAFDTTFDGANDAFVTKLNPAGTALVYSTFLGGSGWEVADAMRLDAFGSAYLVGLTASPDFPVTPGAYSTVYHPPGVSEGDGFVTKLNPAGTALVYSTFIGGTDWDEIFGIALDSSGNAYLSGTTTSADFPTTPDALNRGLQNQDGFIAELDFRGSALLFSTLLGGYSTEATLGIQVDAARDVYTVGWTYSSDFPVTPAAFDRSQSGSPDGFVAKLGIPTGPNTLPRLFWTGAPQYAADGLDPEIGTTGTEFVYRVAYSDGDNDPPADIEVRLQKPLGSPRGTFRMTFETWRGTVGDFSDGANYTFSTALPEVGTDYWYSFNGTDGRGWAIGVPTVPVDAPDIVLGPVTALVVGKPQYTGAVLYVTSSTSLSLSTTDRSGLGIRRTMYRTDENPWVVFSATGPFRLTGESNHKLEWFSEDGAGNGEPHRFANLTVDDTPPVTTISQSTPPPRPGTRFALAATDSRSGVNYTEYRIDDGPWTIYTTPLSVPDGARMIRYRSIDNLGNAEGERTLVITAQIMLPVEFNWKPLVALAFIVILLATGAWSSYRASRNGGDGRRTVLRGFVALALPFVVLEAATGVVSLATGYLSIPPLFGIGTAIDSSIVVAGLAVAIYRGVKARPRVARTQGG